MAVFLQPFSMYYKSPKLHKINPDGGIDVPHIALFKLMIALTVFSQLSPSGGNIELQYHKM